MASSQFPGLPVTVQTATAGALSGDGTSGDKLSVAVDGGNVAVNGSNQIALSDSPTFAGPLTVTAAADIGNLVLTSTAFASLPTPDASTFPIAIVNNSTVTSGTVSAGGGLHVNVIVWTGTVWTVLKNVT